MCAAAACAAPRRTVLTPAARPRRAAALLFLALYMIAFGTGGIKPNVSAFGADQFDVRDPQQRLEKNSFFNWHVRGPRPAAAP